MSHASPAVEAAPATAPAARSGARSFVLWSILLLLLATAIFGAYYLGVFNLAAPDPGGAPLVGPTQTPLVDRTAPAITPTLLPTEIVTPTP